MRPRNLILIVCAMIVGSIYASQQPDENGKYDGIYDRPTYFPDFTPPTRYANNMTYITCARWGEDGGRLANYEVAVYDQNEELRATARSVSRDNERCILTILGTEGDMFHFKVIFGDFEKPTIVDVPQTSNFYTNDIVGHPNHGDPFWLEVALNPELKLWTSIGAQAEEHTILASEIGNDASQALISQAQRLYLQGDWSRVDVSGAFNGCTELRYVEFDELPMGLNTAFTGSNPNCLYFLNSIGANVPLELGNVVAGTDSRALTDITLEDSYPFFSPKDINLNGNEAVYTRQSWNWVGEASAWNTIVLPFDAQLEADNMPLATYAYVENLDSNYVSTGTYGYWLATVERADGSGMKSNLQVGTAQLSANCPYLIAFPGDEMGRVSLQHKALRFVSTSTTIPATPKTLRFSGEDSMSALPFVGTYATISSVPVYELKCGVGADDIVAFVYNECGMVLPFQCYLQPSSSIGTAIIPLDIVINGDFHSGIENVIATQHSIYYTIGGYKVNKPQPGTIIIKNNEKVYIK